MSSNLPIGPNNKGKENQPFSGFFRSVNHFFQEKQVKNFLQQIDEFFSNPFPPLSFPVTVNENEQYTIVKAEMAGVNKEQIQIDVFDNYLTISINHQEIITEEDTNEKTFHSSKTYRKSSRTVSLPHRIEEKRIKASYQNGLLTIKIPKRKGKKILIDD
ncbi:MAG TPA: Hsp20/alpha crystallin family protein [Niallia sp.]|nr:Hsp20/alpha crystallin family protein [Niallia sp.]